MSKENITFVMFKILGNKKDHEFKLEAISENHAIVLAEDLHTKLGLIGRYYCETSTGYTFQIN